MRHPAKASAVALAATMLAALAAGCGAETEAKKATTPRAAARAADPTSAPAATVELSSSSDLGKILVDEKGRTLYLFEADTTKDSTCYDDCAKAWPPLITTGKPKAGEGIKAELLGTSTRDDGSTNVTYNGHPLYYFAGDERPGDTDGQDREGFGAEWYVLNAEGDKVEGGNGDGDGGYGY